MVALQNLASSSEDNSRGPARTSCGTPRAVPSSYECDHDDNMHCSTVYCGKTFFAQVDHLALVAL